MKLKKSRKITKEDNKKIKPENITEEDKKKHKAIGDKIKKKLQENLSREETFEVLYKRKQNEAQVLEDKYQPQLKKGINLNIKFNPISEDKKDGEIDIAVKIAPNTYEDKFKIPSEVQDILGKPLDSGQYKNVYLHKEDTQKVVAVPKNQGSVPIVQQEVAAINKLNSLGIPSVKLLQVIEINDITSYVMKRYKANIKPTAFGGSDLGLLNQNSIDDLINLRNIIKQKQIFIDDLQFLIDSKGNLIVADPMDIVEEEGFESNVHKIEELLVSAAENIILEKLKEVQSGLTKEEIYSMIKLDNDIIKQAIGILKNPRSGQKIRQTTDSKYIIV